MAISKGNHSLDPQEYKRYTGVATMFVKAINPNKKEHEELFNTTLEEAPNYIKEDTDNDGKPYKSARISVIMQNDAEKTGFEMPLVTMALFIQNRYRFNRDKTKVQIIDKYGRTTWASVEDAKANKIPLDKNGKPLNIDKDYRPAYVGEEELMNFVKAYLWIPDITMWDNNTRSFVPNTKVKPEECECRFDDLSKIFTGDFSEIIDALGYQPTNKVKVLLGVRTDIETGKMYQTVLTKKFLRSNATNYKAFTDEVQNMIDYATANGRTLNTEYQVSEVHEYKVVPTTFTPVETEAEDDMPFSSGSPWD